MVFEYGNKFTYEAKVGRFLPRTVTGDISAIDERHAAILISNTFPHERVQITQLHRKSDK